MTRRQRAATAIGAIAIAVGAIAYTTGVGPFATDTCVGIYEDFNGVNDTMSVCDVSISNVKIGNLSGYTTGLHNGCNRVLNTSSTWNDCVSSVRLANLPSSAKAVFYRDAGYLTQVVCVDTNGSSLTNATGGANDVISSFRVIGGNC